MGAETSYANGIGRHITEHIYQRASETTYTSTRPRRSLESGGQTAPGLDRGGRLTRSAPPRVKENRRPAPTKHAKAAVKPFADAATAGRMRCLGLEHRSPSYVG